MTLFELAESPDPGYVVLVMSLNYRTPWEDLPCLEVALRARRLKGPVLFDSLLCNGSVHHRFFVAVFDGERFGPRPLVRLATPPPSVERACAMFYASAVDRVDLTLLTPAVRFGVKRGVVMGSANTVA